MKHSDFVIGEEFEMGVKRWRCTDIGTRTVCAIALGPVEVLSDEMFRVMEMRDFEPPVEKHITIEQAKKDGWFNGPPYAVLEQVIDEYDMETCYKVGENEDLQYESENIGRYEKGK